MSRKVKIQPGDQYGRLTVVKEVQRKNKKSHRRFLCRCECGNMRTVDMAGLRQGTTKSCGCLAAELTVARSQTHGMFGTPIYRVWAAMKARCHNPNVSSYSCYGGRGIKVCDEWMSFEPFYHWALSSGYARGLSIDRINNEGDYKPSNCRWVSYKTQANNTRRNRMLTYNGKTMSVAAWGRATGLHQAMIVKRLNRGWSTERALTTPSLRQA